MVNLILFVKYLSQNSNLELHLIFTLSHKLDSVARVIRRHICVVVPVPGPVHAESLGDSGVVFMCVRGIIAFSQQEGVTIAIAL